MHPFLSLPTSLLALLTTALLPPTSAHDALDGFSRGATFERRPDYLLPRSTDQTEVERRAHHDTIAKRHEVIEARLASQTPIGMRKMSGDPTEKWFPEFWLFEDQESDSTTSAGETDGGRDTRSENLSKKRSMETEFRDAYQNLTTISPFEPPLQLHQASFSPRNSPNNLFRRDYQCLTGYHSCASIGSTGTCCTTDQTCQIITNSGIGSVGCCPSGLTCSGSVGSCDTSQGYSSCPTYQNPDGCCSPGFKCDNIGYYDRHSRLCEYSSSSASRWSDDRDIGRNGNSSATRAKHSLRDYNYANRHCNHQRSRPLNSYDGDHQDNHERNSRSAGPTQQRHGYTRIYHVCELDLSNELLPLLSLLPRRMLPSGSELRLDQLSINVKYRNRYEWRSHGLCRDRIRCHDD